MFSKVVGRPKVKSLSLVKKSLASSVFLLNSSELVDPFRCVSRKSMGSELAPRAYLISDGRRLLTGQLGQPVQLSKV